MDDKQANQFRLDLLYAGEVLKQMATEMQTLGAHLAALAQVFQDTEESTGDGTAPAVADS